MTWRAWRERLHLRTRLQRGLQIWRHQWERRALILTYHRVNPDPAPDFYGLKVHPHQFAQQLAYLQQTYTAVALPELVEQLSQGQLPARRQVAITFDDGYWDNYAFAGPILQQYQLPATFYLSAGYLNTSRYYWWDEVSQVLWHHPAGHLELPDPVGQVYPLSNAASRTQAMNQLCVRLRQVSVPQREAILAQLSQGQRPVASPTDRPMTWEEARELLGRGMTLGAHTCEHPALCSLTPAAAQQEIQQSRQCLETQLQQPITHFSYPHDDADYEPQRLSERSRRLVQAAGFESAVTVVRGFNTPGQDLLALHRITIRNWSVPEFAHHLAQAFQGNC